MKLKKTEDYHEDDDCCLFFSFSRDSDGIIVGEPPEVMFSFGYLEDDFDANKWTHWIDGEDWNWIFKEADPKRFG